MRAGASAGPMVPTRPDASGGGEDVRARPMVYVAVRVASSGGLYGCSTSRTDVGCVEAAFRW